MSTEHPFAATLTVEEPLYVKAVRFEEAKRALNIRVDFRDGGYFGVG